MWTTEEIYVAFRIAQANSKDRPYRLPKNFDSHVQNRMSEKNREALDRSTKYFNTKWSGIQPLEYFNCGFTLFNNFSYIKFFDHRVIKLYIQRDKIRKRETKLSKRKLIDSFKFVKDYMDLYNVETIGRYCMLKEDGHILPISHYLKNHVDSYFIVFLVKSRYLTIPDEDYPFIPYIVEKFRKIAFGLEDIKPFIEKLKEKL